MKIVSELCHEISMNQWQERLREVYIDPDVLGYQQERYQKALQRFQEIFGERAVSIYSAPGRSEIIGNHTDHQNGQVVAAAINDDAIAVVSYNDEPIVRVLSEGYKMITVQLDNVEYVREEAETSLALVKGTIYALRERGYETGGFDVYITSDVLGGSGLSSSAAFEVLLGTIISGLFHDMSISPVVIAQAAQYAENKYFGKPCGLMDQTASSVGGLIHIDFLDTENPFVEKIEVDFSAYGYSLCIVDTKGSHADLTEDYALVPREMKEVAEFFGKDVLRQVSQAEFYQRLDEARTAVHDRAVLRAMHFYTEDKRVTETVNALKENRFKDFLSCIEASGNSSFKFLQNIYSNHDVEHQAVSIGLAVSEEVLNGRGVCRVHGGGFAGTIQAFVPNDVVSEYKKALEQVFGAGSCAVLKVRPFGGIKVM